MFRNQEVSLTLENVAELLEAKGEDRFRIGAYRKAARRIAGLQEDVETVWREGRLRKIRGVGPSIAAKIDELLRTGRIRCLETLRRQVPSGLGDLLLVPGLGTRRARLIYESLGVRSIAELARAAGEHRLCQLPRFGETLEARLLQEALRLTQRTQRLPLGAVLPVAREAASLMRAHPSVRAAEPAGSIRRMCDTIGDLDLLVASLRVLHGSEVNIRSDGHLDYPDEVLRAFDLVLVAIHSGFEQPSDKMTQRMLAGLQSPFAAGLAHPTGRLLGKREASEVDLEAVIRAASQVGVALEINSQPDRMDLPDVWARRAKEAGVPLMINTDAHAADQLDLISYGIAVARRAWLEPQDVLNALPLEDLLARLTRRRDAA